VKDNNTSVNEKIQIRITAIGETSFFLFGNTKEKYKNAAGIILGPTKHILLQNNFQIGSFNEKAINTLTIQEAEAQEKMAKEIFTLL